MFTKKKLAAVIGGLAIAGATTGAAFAYWTNTGTGTGTATTGTNAAITINQTSTVAALYPGGTAQSLSGTFTNPNAAGVRVASVQATGVTVDATHAAAGCAAGDYVLGGTATVGIDVISGTPWSGLTIAMNNTTSNQDACKGASLTIAYTSN
jgi:hypothetical protein